MQTRKKTDFPFKKSKISERLVKFYTGLQNHGVFIWIYNRIHKKAEKLQYFRGHLQIERVRYLRSLIWIP